MTDIILATLNARYWHSSFGLRYLLANMGELAERTQMLEFGLKEHSVELLAAILNHQPKIVGFGVYIWNVEQTTRVVAELKRVAPHVHVVLGGPEVSYESDQQAIVQYADHVVAGEADLAFPDLCRQLLQLHQPQGSVPSDASAALAVRPPKFVAAPPPVMDDLALPYHLYSDEDIRHRVIYVEASRGCPFTCEFCLSALDIPVRLAGLDRFLAAMQDLLDRGARQFKFVDRTFNLNLRVSTQILQFFLDRYQPGMFLHFEMIPDRLPAALRQLISQFPPGVLQFEIGVQTFNDDVGERISRRQDNAELARNFEFLRSETGVHIHADLIVGLPGETWDSFAAGFDRLIELAPQEIQVGILKRLRGTPITRHDTHWQMVYSPHPPYEILANSELDFASLQRLRRFARFWDLIGNSGNFKSTCPLLWQDGSPFAGFMGFCDWLHQREGRQHGFSLIQLCQRIFEYLTTGDSADASSRETSRPKLPAQRVAELIWQDYVAGGRSDRPKFLREFQLPPAPRRTSESDGPKRQARHV